MSSGSCQKDRQVSKGEGLAAAQELGSDKTKLANVNENGLRGRPAGCTMHNWGNVEWWGPSDNAPCGSLNYNCVCKEKEYVKMSSGTCPEDRQVSKEEGLAAAQELGSDKTKLANVNERGLRGRPAGCTIHNWGNVDWWGPSDNAPCGSLNYNCVCQKKYVKMSSGSCPKDRQVSKEECLAAAQELGSDKTKLANVNENGLRGRPAGCTMHNWGNVEWWGPSDNAPCGSLNYNC